MFRPTFRVEANADWKYWTAEELDPMSVRELREVAEEYGIESARRSKQDLIEELLNGDD